MSLKEDHCATLIALVSLNPFLLLSASLLVLQLLSDELCAPLFGRPAIPTPEASPLLMLGSLWLVALVNTVILGILVRRAQFGGWKLAWTVVVISFGIGELLNQVEALFFGQSVGVGPRHAFLFMTSGLLSRVLWAPLAVWGLGRWEQPPESREPLPFPGWIRFLGLAFLAYPVIYFAFGAVASQAPALQDYYAEYFRSHSQAGLAALIALQMARGLVWVGLGWLMLACESRVGWSAALLMAAVFSLLSTIVLVIPNPFMPGPVRWVHFWEVTSSNFLFGLLTTRILTSRRLWSYHKMAHASS